jgi:anthrone oxygenase-like protein
VNFELVATSCAGLFAGAAIYITLVEHPARLECGTETAVTVLIGGLLLGLVIPFTLVVILPTNRRLLDPTLVRGSAEAAALLPRWGQLHAARSGASALAFGLLLWDLAREATG